MRITVDFISAERIRAVFHRLAETGELPRKELRSILDETEGYCNLMRFYGGESFKSNYLDMWETLSRPTPYSTTSAVLERMRGAYLQVLRDPEVLDSKLEFARKVDLPACGRVALDYLPAGTEIQTSVWFLVDGFNQGSVTHSGICLDVWAIQPDLFNEIIVPWLAHELFHIGFAYWRSLDALQKVHLEGDVAASSAFALVSGLLDEGTAHHSFVSNPEDIAVFVERTYGAEFAKRFRERADVSIDGTKELEHLDHVLKELLLGSPDEARARQLNAEYSKVGGITDPKDKLVGALLVKSIEDAFGRMALQECIRDLRQFVPKFNSAAASLGLRALSPEIEAAWCNLWRQ